MKIKRILPEGPLGAARQLEAPGRENMFMGEIYGICSLIFLSDVYEITSADDARHQVELACKTQRGYGQALLYAFHPALHPEVAGYLTEAGWNKLIVWPSGHPGDNPMELWGVLTGQEPH